MLTLDLAKAQPKDVPRISDGLCQACRKCLAREVCRSKAILQIDPGEPPFIDANLCYGCRACIVACSYGAIQIE